MSEFTQTELRDLSAIEGHARETLRQCEYLRRNGAGDRIRFGIIANEAWRAWRSASKADRRYAKESGLFCGGWRLPTNYDRPLTPKGAA